MTPQEQTPHFPCGPCPLEDYIHKAIQQYFAFSESLSSSIEGDTSKPDKQVTLMMISLVDSFIHLLHDMRLVADTKIDHSYLEELE